ncbi:TMEM175 family protein [Methanobrevibacter sp.]|uniref:TMEM175 family protein n=1 Tax=Methanobrevibacter sp. TaxID=66852 RepID=UPI00388D0223
MNETNPDELEKIREDIQEKIIILKDNTESDEELEKLGNFESYFSSKIPKKEEKTKNKDLKNNLSFKDALEKDLNIDPSRLVGLTDGIFGMVMTLLVFGIALPELQITDYSTFLSFFTSLAPTIGVTIVSFVLISSFWVYHHEFIKLNKVNFPVLWLNIFYLICISFIPFSTSLIGNYSHFFLSEVIFGINILLTILAFLLLYDYTSKRDFLENHPSKKEKKYVHHTFLIIMGLTVIVNLLDFNISRRFIYLFLLVPIISTLRDIKYKMKS